jgi:hypothetical protein
VAAGAADSSGTLTTFALHPQAKSKMAARRMAITLFMAISPLS